MSTLTRIFSLGALFFGLAAPLPAWAQQQFATEVRGAAQTFRYAWVDGRGAPQTLEFRLNVHDIARGSTEFGPWDKAKVQAMELAAAQAKARELSTPNLTVLVEPNGRGFDITARSQKTRPTEAQLAQIRAAIRGHLLQANMAYARQSFYTAEETRPGELTIQPDHPRLAQRYTAAMGPVAAAMRAKLPNDDPRVFIDYALNWLQSMPYDRLENRRTSNGAGFQTPYGLLQGNRGDCDTKTTALAALLRARFPGLRLAMVYVPEHAFLGIGIPQTDKDYALRDSTGTWVLADPTGPSLTPLGQINEEVQAKARRGAAEIVVIP